MINVRTLGRTAGLSLLTSCIIGFPAFAQTKRAAPKAPKTTLAKKPIATGFKRIGGGLEYKVIEHGKGTYKAQLGDHIEMHIYIHDGDSVLFDSRKMNNNNAVPMTCEAPKFKADLVQGIRELVEGDSAIFRVLVDSFRKSGIQLPPWTHDGEYIEYNTRIVSIQSPEAYKKDMNDKASKQYSIDEKILQDYFAKHNLKPMKTASGLYYTLANPGNGNNLAAGISADVNYTGMFLDGKKFDSNTDSAFHHVQPFTVEVGKGKVIKGWDEGLQLLKKGAKATFYIPSILAYGSVDRQTIPANSILLFDIDVLDVHDPSSQNNVDDQLIQAYVKAHNLKATKTTSGLYYVITQKGQGEFAKPGKKVTMNYTGKTLDGVMFDSNTDPSKGHVEPFSFNLGQGQVIKGWDEGVALLQKGSKATFLIPSALGYGAQGAGGAIPPNAVLLFDVELVGME